MEQSYFDLDLFVHNSVELPKAGKAEDIVIDTKYTIKDIKIYFKNKIVDIEAKLVITILYKSVDHTIRWNEQVVHVSTTSIIEDKQMIDIDCQCINIKKITDKLVVPNIYNQQIFICFRVFHNQEIRMEFKHNSHEMNNSKDAKARFAKEVLKTQEEVSCSFDDKLSNIIDELLKTLKT